VKVKQKMMGLGILVRYNSFNKNGVGKTKYNSTQKPVELMEWLIESYSNENDTILDNTMGSGTTMVACKNLNRNGIGIEKDKHYYDIAVRRVGL